MKFINLLLLTLLLAPLTAQVNVKGAETTKTISNQREVVFERKEIDVTKYVEEGSTERVVLINNISGAELVESSDDAVRIKISPRGADAGITKDGVGVSPSTASPSDKKRIVIDLGKPTTVKKAEPETESEVEKVADEITKEAESKLVEAEKKAEGALTDVRGRQIKGGGGDAGAINNWSIFFDTDGFNIRTEYNVVIYNIATYLALNPDVKVKLVGYADTRYTPIYNLQLSNRRVNQVANRLKALGIDESRLETEAKGDTKALVDVDKNKGSLKHQLNRRVTITFLD